MSGFKGSTFNDRRDAAANARKAMLEKFQARPGPDDPVVVARAAERRAIAEARDKREAERRIAREAEQVRLAAEQKAREEEAARLAAEAEERERQLKAEQKAARDARYAARKAKNKRR